jgi:hypothetical protein
MTDDVAETPLMVVVRTFPVRFCVNELMMFAAVEAMPFTVDESVFASDVKIFEVTAVVVATTPFTVDERMLPEVVAELVVGPTSDDVAVHVGTPPTIERMVPFAPGAYGVAIFDASPMRRLPSARGILGRTENVVVPSVVVPFTVRLLFKKRFVPVALPKKSEVKFASVEKRLVVVAFAAVKLVTKELVEVELVVVRFCTKPFVVVALTVDIFVPLAVLKPKFVV